MFENIKNIFKRNKKRELLKPSSKDTAKERLHLVLMQDRANVSADFLDLMRKEIIEVIKKYIDIDEEAMDVRLAAETNEDGTQGAPALYANIPIINIKDETRQMSKTNQEKQITVEPNKHKKEPEKEAEQAKTKTQEVKESIKEQPKEKHEKIETEKKVEEKKVEIKEIKKEEKEEKQPPKEEKSKKEVKEKSETKKEPKETKQEKKIKENKKEEEKKDEK